MKSSDNVLYEDNHLIAFDKPPGVLTQKDERKNVEDLLKDYLKEKYQKKGAVYLHAVHRLDKDVSGVVLFAKTSKALSRLNVEMRERRVKKVYYALVMGEVKEKKQVLELNLEHDRHRAKVVSVGGKKSTLAYERIGKNLLKIALHTGRYHQIRVMLSYVGHPIKGDTKYGAEQSDRLYLHHTSMSFIHPVTKDPIEIVSPCPFHKA